MGTKFCLYFAFDTPAIRDVDFYKVKGMGIGVHHALDCFLF